MTIDYEIACVSDITGYIEFLADEFKLPYDVIDKLIEEEPTLVNVPENCNIMRPYYDKWDI